MCLISDGVGRDNISDFTAKLIKHYLCGYTASFTIKYLRKDQMRLVGIGDARFHYGLSAWVREEYWLPWKDGDYVLLTPKDMLTRDENWINRGDLITGFERIPPAIPDAELRDQVSSYFASVLVRPKNREPNKKERGDAAARTMLKFPELIDYYIRMKEDDGEHAASVSAEKVEETERFFIEQIRELQRALLANSRFYEHGQETYEEAHARLRYLKDVIENKGGYRLFYDRGQPIGRERDLQVLYRLVWYGSPSDVGTEANDGGGPVDFKISRGSDDKTLVEMKLAKNKGLERNLQRQVPIYQKASDAKAGIKAIVYFTYEEQCRVERIIDKLGLRDDKEIYLIDARADNKPSGSKA
ncbi:hypothetical protein [Hyphomicrobium sp. NDB2Meth4]|uniref:hypothetical protein n=1 Tax=Hyphomicrobium sp. NDB2Meth4 TaxID=1892846 RepID=UPI001FCCE8BF|nr:hypothetical protein [Hyphomicrobium sp. NDB2Meth4]